MLSTEKKPQYLRSIPLFYRFLSMVSPEKYLKIISIFDILAFCWFLSILPFKKYIDLPYSPWIKWDIFHILHSRYRISSISSISSISKNEKKTQYLRSIPYFIHTNPWTIYKKYYSFLLSSIFSIFSYFLSIYLYRKEINIILSIDLRIK